MPACQTRAATAGKEGLLLLTLPELCLPDSCAETTAADAARTATMRKRHLSLPAMLMLASWSSRKLVLMQAAVMCR
jgi:hypothetical protein